MQMKPFLTNVGEISMFGWEKITSFHFICPQWCGPSRSHAIPPSLRRAMRVADSLG